MTKRIEREKEIKKLTWKYFIDQKIIEIVGGVLSLSIVFLILSTLGRLDYLKICGELPICSSFLIVILTGLANLILIVAILAIFGLGLVILYLLCSIIYESILEPWIKSNWRKAKQKAKEELR